MKKLLDKNFIDFFSSKVNNGLATGKVSHRDILKFRDDTFSERYDELKKGKGNAEEIEALGKMAKALGSKAVDEKKAVKENIKTNAVL